VLAQHDGGYAGSSDKKKPRRRRGPSVRALRGVRALLYVVYGLYWTLRNDFGVFRSGTIPGRGDWFRKEKPRRATELKANRGARGFNNRPHPFMFAGQHVRIGAAADCFCNSLRHDALGVRPHGAARCAQPRLVAVVAPSVAGRALTVRWVGLKGHAKWAGQILQHRSRIWLYRAR
jgi:hypothetical protein